MRNTKYSVYWICFLLSATVFGIATFLVSNPFITHFSIENPNSPSNVETLINGVTTSTSIIVGFSGVIAGSVVRGLLPNDEKSKTFYGKVLASFTYVFVYLFLVYFLLSLGQIDLALRWSLDGLLLALLIFVIVVLYVLNRLDKTKFEKATLEKEEPVEQKPEEGKTEEESKNVNVFVNVNNQS